MKEWYSISAPDVLKALGTDKAYGLNRREALRREKLYGKNIIEEVKVNPLKIYVKQYKEPLILFLVVVSAFILLQSIEEFAFVWTFLLIVTLISFYYEYKSEKIIKGIKSLIVYKVRVVRNGKETEVDSKYLVPGDIILLDRGDKVPADARIVEEKDLETDESLITGESFSVRKTSKQLTAGLPPNEQSNILFAGSTILKGNCKAVVVSTGKETYIGKIGFMLKAEKKKSLVSEEVTTVFLYTVSFFLVSLALVFFLLKNYYDFTESVSIVVALGVSVIPQSLPLIITIVLAISAYELGKKSILTRNVYSLENAALVDTICMDKTGTLTKNQMTARVVYTDKHIEITGEGYTSKGSFLLNKKPYDIRKDARLIELLKCAAFANDAILERISEEEFKVIGSSTEGALLVLVEKSGLGFKQNKDNILIEIPFDEERKMHSVVYRMEDRAYVFSKGSPEKILELSDWVYPSNRLGHEAKETISRKVEELAAQGYRVLAFAMKNYSGEKNVEEKLTFLGLIGLIDPVRKEVKEFVEKCKSDGIELKILTGDHPLTAINIAKEAGIDAKACITGKDLEKLSEEEFEKVVRDANIFARVLPEQKLKIVHVLKELGCRVMVTGDGVNDVLAFKSSHVGVSMERGSDIAKEFSDLILVEENFANIYQIIEEGKKVVEKIRSAFVYLISTSIAEVMYVLSVLLGTKLGSPLTAIQILWMNVITEGIPAAGFAFERKFKRKNYKDEPTVSSSAVISRIIFQASFMGVISFLSFILYLQNGFGYAATFAFSVLVFFEIFNALNNRSLDIPNVKLGFSNRNIFVLFFVCLTLQIITLQTPVANYLGLTILSLKDFLLTILIGSSILIVGETIKLVQLKFFPNSSASKTREEKSQEKTILLRREMQ
jgi:Ca2+-transporting ATPase